MNLKRIFQLILIPNKFIEADIEKVRKLRDLEGRAIGDLDEYRKNITKWVTKKNKGIWESFVIVAFLIALGIFAAYFVNPYINVSIFTLRVLRTCSLGIVAWAVLSRLGYDEETAGKVSLLEEISPQLFRLFYYIGILLTVFTLFLEPETASNNSFQPTAEGG